MKLSRKFEVHATHQSLTRHVRSSHGVLAVVTLQRAVAGLGFAAGQTFRPSMPHRNRLTIRPSGLAEKHRQPLNSSVGPQKSFEARYLKMVVCRFRDTLFARRFRSEMREVTKDICARAEADVRELLPSLPERVEVVVQASKRVIPRTGDMGSAVSPGRVLWCVDSSRCDDFVGIASRQLRPTLFHEFHHLSRGWVKSDYKRVCPRIIDAAVSEGLAVAFERDFGGRTAPWASYPHDAAIWVEELLAQPAGASYRDWMFHHPDGRSWIGYRAGTFLADRAVAASGKSSAELVTTTTVELLRMAGFAYPSFAAAQQIAAADRHPATRAAGG